MCDAAIDEDDALDAQTWFGDADGDGYGDASTMATACAAPSGFVADATDCDDTAGAVNPGAVEVCDAADVDEDCSGAADDADAGGTGRTTWHADVDSDAYGDPSVSLDRCEQPSGYVADSADCDDADEWVYPGAVELCDGMRNDCDDTSWSDDAGLASIVDAAGSWSDATATLSAGTSASVASVSLSDETLQVCEGTWYVSVSLSGSGGGIDSTGDLIGEELELSGNHANNTGGGIHMASGANVTLTDSYVYDNTHSQSSKGAINNGGSVLQLNNVDFSGNLDHDVKSSANYTWDTTGITYTCDSTGCN